MHFEHLIEINAPRQTVIEPFPRSALWRGLMLRVHEPQRFPLGPDRCEVAESDQPGVLRRTLAFGALRFSDTVRLESGEAVYFRPDPHGDTTPVDLTIRIEALDDGGLLLRFVYESRGPLTADEAFYNEYRQNAWLENDRDMVRALRQWLVEGALTLS
ncbi:AtaL-like protein [Aquabacterium sp.]|uniref:AtaL-like protein n=1 Tax=Aquabacterium sp. TaxID=1872578 RepID=UPI0035AF0F11